MEPNGCDSRVANVVFLLLLLSCCQICFLIVLASYPVSVHRSDAPPTQHIRACGTMLTGRTTGSHHPRYARHDFETRYVSFKTRYVFPLRVAFLFFTRYVFFMRGGIFGYSNSGAFSGPKMARNMLRTSAGPKNGF